MNEQEFINIFSIGLTNTTLEERKEIGKKYYNKIQQLKIKNGELQTDLVGYKAFYKLAISQRNEAEQKLEKIKELCKNKKSLCNGTTAYQLGLSILQIIKGDN